jgi:hypothetical protein
VVVANRDPLFEPVLDKIRDGQVVVDLVRLRTGANQRGTYRGLAW